jgi:hypothetical protein
VNPISAPQRWHLDPLDCLTRIDTCTGSPPGHGVGSRGCSGGQSIIHPPTHVHRSHPDHPTKSHRTTQNPQSVAPPELYRIVTAAPAPHKTHFFFSISPSHSALGGVGGRERVEEKKEGGARIVRVGCPCPCPCPCPCFTLYGLRSISGKYSGKSRDKMLIQLAPFHSPLITCAHAT